MGLIGNGIYYSPRSGILPGAVSAVGSCPVSRPIWNGVCHRQIFDKDYLAFPSGSYQDAIVFSIKYGGMGVHNTSASSVSADISGWGSVGSGIAGSSAASGALTGLKDSPCYSYGTGSMQGGPRGTGSISCSISIGAQPSAFDIAQAVWGMDNAIETGWTPRQVMRVLAAAMAGKVSGSGTNAPVFRSITDAKDRITATTDADGNRVSVSLDSD